MNDRVSEEQLQELWKLFSHDLDFERGCPGGGSARVIERLSGTGRALAELLGSRVRIKELEARLAERDAQRCETCHFGFGGGQEPQTIGCKENGDWWEPSEGCSRWQPREEPTDG